MTSTEREPGPAGLVWFTGPPPPRATPQLSRERVVATAIELADRQPDRRDHHAGAGRGAGRAQPDGPLPLRGQQERAGRPDGRPGVRAAHRGPRRRLAARAARPGPQRLGRRAAPPLVRPAGLQPAAAGPDTRSASTTPPWPSWSRSTWTRPRGWGSSQPCSARSSDPGWPCWRSRPCGPGPAWPPRPTWTKRPRRTWSGSPPPGPTRTSPAGPPTPSATPLPFPRFEQILDWLLDGLASTLPE